MYVNGVAKMVGTPLHPNAPPSPTMTSIKYCTQSRITTFLTISTKTEHV